MSCGAELELGEGLGHVGAAPALLHLGGVLAVELHGLAEVLGVLREVVLLAVGLRDREDQARALGDPVGLLEGLDGGGVVRAVKGLDAHVVEHLGLREISLRGLLREGRDGSENDRADQRGLPHRSFHGSLQCGGHGASRAIALLY
jgi:hypothetical protein